jgi:hypothetical protein
MGTSEQLSHEDILLLRIEVLTNAVHALVDGMAKIERDEKGELVRISWPTDDGCEDFISVRA